MRGGGGCWEGVAEGYEDEIMAHPREPTGSPTIHTFRSTRHKAPCVDLRTVCWDSGSSYGLCGAGHILWPDEECWGIIQPVGLIHW